MTDKKDDKPNNTTPHHVQVREDRMKLQQGSIADAKDRAQQKDKEGQKGKK